MGYFMGRFHFKFFISCDRCTVEFINTFTYFSVSVSFRFICNSLNCLGQTSALHDFSLTSLLFPLCMVKGTLTGLSFVKDLMENQRD